MEMCLHFDTSPFSYVSIKNTFQKRHNFQEAKGFKAN